VTRFLVPRRPDGGWRDEVWRYTRGWWERFGFEFLEGASPPGPFNRAAALNNAARGEWDVGVVLDADVILDHPEQFTKALVVAKATGRVVLPYTQFKGLHAAATRMALTGEDFRWSRGVRFQSRLHESSVVVVPRKLWDELGGFDERFSGWGLEDVAFAHAARLLGGVERIEGIVWHLWHERARSRKASPNYSANVALARRYRQQTTAEQMRRLLAERSSNVSTDATSGGVAGRARVRAPA
jgi:hypothetical protein